MKIAIAGYGIEGKASLEYWQTKEKDAEITVLDEREQSDIPEDIQHRFGPDIFNDLGSYDLVVRTAGLPPQRLSSARKVWSATNEFFDRCPAPIIGVTGTKGKGTTCSLIANILRADGKTVHLLGNIGTPALQVLPQITQDDIVVYELSSFQLWDVETSPHTAVILMIEPDHLNVHVDMQEYVQAKANITRHQNNTDILVYNNHCADVQTISDQSPAGIKIGYQDPRTAHVTDGYIWYGEQKICSISALRIPGKHNYDNVSAAIDACWSYIDTAESIENGISQFHGLPHRLKFVAEKKGVRYYDDSIATTPGSAIAALDSFDAPKIIILGGSDKGSSYDAIIGKCRDVGATVIAIGQTGEQIYELALAAGITVYRIEGRMDEVVPKAAEIAVDGSVVILSPASASFGQYENYADRGDKFVEAVTQLVS